MSWSDKLKNVLFTIKTGDGKSYTPLWKSGEKSKTFNTTKYDFINRSGSFIDRKKPQSNTYPLVFWFQGDNNIEQCNAFENSANNPKSWVVEHPFYGTIKGQPVNLKRSDINYNVTEVSVDFWESLKGDEPLNSISIVDQTRDKATVLKEIAATFLVENGIPLSSDIDTTKQNIVLTSSKFQVLTENFNNYKNIVNKATLTADKLITDTPAAFNAIQKAIDAPSDFTGSVFDKLNSYVGAYEVIKNSIKSIYSKFDFESQGATILAAVCVSCILPNDDDYITRADIEKSNSLLNFIYKDYLKTLDENQVSIYDVNNRWSPTSQIQNAVIDLVTFTSKSLFNLSFNARQERTIELKKDSNLIILTHRFLGLDAEDKNIDTFRTINGIKNNEIFQIKKGRFIKYFV